MMKWIPQLLGDATTCFITFRENSRAEDKLNGKHVNQKNFRVHEKKKRLILL